jgi:Uncharacterised nucleotidyltransferase
LNCQARVASRQGDHASGNLDARSVIHDWPRIHRVATPGEAVWFVSRCLSYEDSATERAELQHLLRRGEIDWPLVASLANRAHLTPALHLGLQRKALTELLPSDCQLYLSMIHDLNQQRNRRIVQQSTELFTALNQQGLRPVLMKGGLSLFETGSDDGLFMMADMDALLAEKEIPLAYNVLRSLGYVKLGDPPAHAHALTFDRAGELATIDLHRCVGPQVRLLNPEEARLSATALAGSRLNLAGLSPTHRVLLLLMSYCLFEPQFRSFELPLKGLHDLAVICRRHGRSIDWTRIADVMRHHSLEAAARAWFTMAHHLLLVPIPRHLCRSRADRRHLRRCLLQLDHPQLARPLRFAARLAWIFGALRMDYRYGCGLSGLPLSTARLRHALGIVRRHLRIDVVMSDRVPRWR